MERFVSDLRRSSGGPSGPVLEPSSGSEIDNPYVVGVPLSSEQEVFVGRTDVCARIGRLLGERRQSPLLLYGQRRIGKTSLLLHLERFFPAAVVPLFADLQGPATLARDHAGFLYNLARSMSRPAWRRRRPILPPLSRGDLADEPFTRFDEWLDEVEGELGRKTVLLLLDEIETLDRAFAEGRFDEAALLGMLRHLIQHRLRFKILLAGSHTLDELQRWPSYLINVQVVKVGYLTEAETRQLVEHPVRHFALRYEPEASRRVLELTRGHPFLVQLLCAEIVGLKNDQGVAVRHVVRRVDVETAVPAALGSGSLFFLDLQHHQVDEAGLALLRFVARKGEGAVVSPQALIRSFPDELERTLAQLIRRELFERYDGGYRFQVELIRRWFAERPTPSSP